MTEHHTCRDRGYRHHGCPFRGSDGHGEPLSSTSTPTRLPLPLDWVSTLLGNVPLPVSPICAADADHAFGGGDPASMNTTLTTSVTGPCSSQAAMEPPTDASGNASELQPLIWAAPASTASSEETMPPLDGPEDSDEMEEGEAGTEGIVCAVTPTPKRDEHR